MDVVLEIFDTFLLDRAYAYFLPAYSNPLVPKLNANGTYSSVQELLSTVRDYHYEPASEYLRLEPSDFAYMSRWPRNDLYRQSLSLFLITCAFGFFFYLSVSTLSYFLVYDKTNFQHPRYLRNQIAQEIKCTLSGVHWIALFTTPFFLAEVRGYSKLYDTTESGPGWWYDILQFPLFLLFTDFFIYWIHRGLHHPAIYKNFHKAHHRWVVPTPFASHAFHPLDGFSQSIPYHIFPFIFPLQKFAYIALFMFINVWTVLIHDGEYAMNSPVLNGAACHTMHHLYFNYNYGQFTTLWDRLGGSYRQPNEELFRREEKMGKKEWERQTKEADDYIKDVEGEDDRTYEPETVAANGSVETKPSPRRSPRMRTKKVQ